jgi:hypothetical protein
VAGIPEQKNRVRRVCIIMAKGKRFAISNKFPLGFSKYENIREF